MFKFSIGQTVVTADQQRGHVRARSEPTGDDEPSYLVYCLPNDGLPGQGWRWYVPEHQLSPFAGVSVPQDRPSAFGFERDEPS